MIVCLSERQQQRKQLEISDEDFHLVEEGWWSVHGIDGVMVIVTQVESQQARLIAELRVVLRCSGMR